MHQGITIQQRPKKLFNVLGWFVVFIRWFEYVAASFPTFRSLYGRIFYSAMVKREMEIAGLSSGAKVLHVGCGPMPFTAIALAQLGLRVTAVDVNTASVISAKKVIEESGLSSMITVLCMDGVECDVSRYDGVWLSLHVEPKEELVLRLMADMRDNGVLIYRNPRGWLRWWYQGYYPAKPSQKAKNFLGKESIKLEKQHELTPDRQDGICRETLWDVSLEDLAPGEAATILDVPPVSLLPPLGYRPGKQVRVKVKGVLSGPVVAEIEGRNSALARSLARAVKVRINPAAMPQFGANFEGPRQSAMRAGYKQIQVGAGSI